MARSVVINVEQKVATKDKVNTAGWNQGSVVVQPLPEQLPDADYADPG